MSEQEIYNGILEKFSRIPIPEDESTFLDLCHYSGERFEEICSRILEFYFQPNNKHGFGDLWFKSLCQLIGYECDDAFEMKTRTEESTYGAVEKNKRIDIVLQTPSLIVAIENKIGADLYNNLDIYSEHIHNTYPSLKQKLVVLTAHSFATHERIKANQSGFVVIGYKQLFITVKSLIGDYVSKGDQKYLVFMLDFMKTVENRANIMAQTDLDKFFSSKKEEIEKLFEQYNGWKNRLLGQQKEAIFDLSAKIQSLTNTIWWVYQGWDLGISFNDGTPYRIGIESNFKEVNNNPLGEFHIYITTWNTQCWLPYESAILEKYPGYLLDKGEHNSSNRVYYHMPVIERVQYNSNEQYFEEILQRLDNYYRFMKDLTANYAGLS